jgi:hypothetical protein
MEWEQIRKRPEDFACANLQNYERCVGTFSWAQARGLLDGLPGGGLNVAHEAVDRHVLAGRGGKLALRWSVEMMQCVTSVMRNWARRAINSPTCWHSVESPKATACSRCLAAVRSCIWRRLARSSMGVFSRRCSRRLGPSRSNPECPLVSKNSRHERGFLPAQDRTLARRASQPPTRAADRMFGTSAAGNDKPRCCHGRCVDLI